MVSFLNLSDHWIFGAIVTIASPEEHDAPRFSRHGEILKGDYRAGPLFERRTSDDLPLTLLFFHIQRNLLLNL